MDRQEVVSTPTREKNWTWPRKWSDWLTATPEKAYRFIWTRTMRRSLIYASMADFFKHKQIHGDRCPLNFCSSLSNAIFVQGLVGLRKSTLLSMKGIAYNAFFKSCRVFFDRLAPQQHRLFAGLWSRSSSNFGWLGLEPGPKTFRWWRRSEPEIWVPVPQP